MNRTFMAILIKIVAVFIATWIAFDLFMDEGNSFGWILIVGIVVAIVSYLIGDLMLFRNFGNIIASVFDGLIAVALAYIFDLLIENFDTNFGPLLVYFVLITLFELAFHRYLERQDEVAP